MTPERIAEIRERVERATAGPWGTEFNHQPSGCWITTGAPIGGLVASVFSDDGLPNADFIVHARQDVPDLLDALAALQQENARLRAALTEVTDTAWGEWIDAVDIARNALKEKPRD